MLALTERLGAIVILQYRVSARLQHTEDGGTQYQGTGV